LDDLRPSGRAEFDRGREPPDKERLDEVVDLLSVRDTSERRILPADAYAGVPHDGDQETRLTVRETERRERSIAFSGKTIRIRPDGFMLDAPNIARLGARTNAPSRPIPDTKIDNLPNRSYAGFMNLQVPPELEAKLTRMAAETGRTADQVALDLLASSMDHDEWFRAEVEKGRAAAGEGRLLEHDDVAARMDRRYRG
jgi:predicted transcriptional regulator